MGVTEDFFEVKRSWSMFKDEMLGWYLKPYINKLLCMNKSLFLIDCFAGKGKFSDGKDGSPLIISKQIQEMIERDEKNIGKLYGVFIEKKYEEELEKNINGYKNCKAYKGRFEDYIKNICKVCKNGNVFLYIDPYGIKSLKFEYLNSICNSSKEKCNSLEILINFNSNGFIREGCRLLKYKIEDELLIEEYENNYEFQDISKEYLTKIIDSDKWKDYIKLYYRGKMSYHDVEESIANEYVNSLKEKFLYCLNIPIKTKEKNIPKYRMIFCTNSVDGLLLMNEKMHNTVENMREEERKGQLSLFALPEMQNDEKLNNYIIKILSEVDKIKYEELVCDIIKDTNIIHTEKHIREALKEMEKKEVIKVSRKPKNGSIPKSKLRGWDWKKNNIIITLFQQCLITKEGII